MREMSLPFSSAAMRFIHSREVALASLSESRVARTGDAISKQGEVEFELELERPAAVFL